MRDRIYCRRHKRWHSAHAATHCREKVRAGDCIDRKGAKRDERCPIWAGQWGAR